jgi:Predicted Na+-dependent transporter
MYESLQSLDNVIINFNAGSMHIVNVILAFIMFGVALEIKVSDFKEIFYKPKSLFLGLACQWLGLPLITFAIVALGHKLIPPGIAMGMILVAACPGGNMSNFISSVAKANVSLSVSLTGITTIMAVVMTPLNFRLWGSLYVNFLSKRSDALLQPITISFWQMLFTLTILLILPITLGILFAYYFPKAKKKISKPVKVLSILAFFAILVGAVMGNMDVFMNHLFYIFIIVFVHNGLALATGYTTGLAFKVTPADRRSLMIETGIQNSGLGLALLFNPKIFPAGIVTGGMLMVVAWWGVWHIVSGLTVAFGCRMKYKRQQAKQQ